MGYLNWGATTEEIAFKFGVSEESVLQAIKCLPPRKRQPMTIARITEIARVREEEGLTYRQLEIRFKCSKTHLIKNLKKHGLYKGEK